MKDVGFCLGSPVNWAGREAQVEATVSTVQEGCEEAQVEATVSTVQEGCHREKD